jgi:hypothetical protein
MNITCRILLGLGLTSALAAALGYFGATGPTHPAPPTAPDDIRFSEQEERRRARLDLYRARLFRSMETKRQVAEELVDGGLTFFQAVVRFQRVERGLPAAAWRLRALRLRFPGNSDTECWCRKVIHYLRATWPESARARRAARRLEGELDRHLRRYGTIRLPVLPPGSAFLSRKHQGLQSQHIIHGRATGRAFTRNTGWSCGRETDSIFIPTGWWTP